MSLQKVSLKYIVDPDISEKKVPQGLDPGIRLVQELMPALEDPGLDAVIAASPTACHFDQIGRALQAGKHVFSEKPLGHSLKEITNSYQLAREKQKALYLGFQRRYDRNFSVLKSKIEQIAPLRLYRASSRDNPKPALEYLKISGNIFHDMLIHDFDMLVYLLGPKVPNLITSMAYAHDEEIAGIPDFDHVMVTLMYADGLICSIDTSRDASYGYDQRIGSFRRAGHGNCTQPIGSHS